jgi:hypothetical protein
LCKISRNTVLSWCYAWRYLHRRHRAPFIRYLATARHDHASMESTLRHDLQLSRVSDSRMRSPLVASLANIGIRDGRLTKNAHPNCSPFYSSNLRGLGCLLGGRRLDSLRTKWMHFSRRVVTAHFDRRRESLQSLQQAHRGRETERDIDF